MASVDAKMKAGAYVRLLDGCIYYVDSVTGSGAHLIPLTGKPVTIRARNGKTKEVYRHERRHIVISTGAVVEHIDPAKLDGRLMHRRIDMARKENEGGTEAAAPAEARASKIRMTQEYKLTNKAPKDTMKGQGKLVYDVLKEMGGQATVGALTEKVKATGQLVTRQDAERVVGFYLSKFKRDGLAEAIRPQVAAEQAAAAAV